MDLNREVIHFQYQSFELRIIVSKPGADSTLIGTRVRKRSLKADLCPELDPARIVLAGGFAEGTIGQVCIDGVQVRPVERVEEIEAKLEADTLHDLRILGYADVSVGIPRLSEAVRRLVALGAQCWRRKLPGGEDAREISSAAGGLGIV